MEATQALLVKISPILDVALKNAAQGSFGIVGGPGEVPSHIIISRPHESVEKYVRRIVSTFFAEDRNELAVCTIQQRSLRMGGRQDIVVLDTFTDGECATSVCSITGDGYTFVKKEHSPMLSLVKEEMSSVVKAMN